MLVTLEDRLRQIDARLARLEMDLARTRSYAESTHSEALHGIRRLHQMISGSYGFPPKPE